MRARMLAGRIFIVDGRDVAANGCTDTRARRRFPRKSARRGGGTGRRRRLKIARLHGLEGSTPFLGINDSAWLLLGGTFPQSSHADRLYPFCTQPGADPRITARARLSASLAC